MLSHLSEYDGKHEPVDVSELKTSVVEKVLDAADKTQPNTTFNAQTQLQGFLKAFQDTRAFAAQFAILDERTQEQIRAFQAKPLEFQDTTAWKETDERGGFRLPVPNPDTSQILGTPTTSAGGPSWIGKFFLNTFTSLLRPLVLFSLKVNMNRAARKLDSTQTRRYIRGPVIFEDEKNLSQMAVHYAL